MLLALKQKKMQMEQAAFLFINYDFYSINSVNAFLHFNDSL